MRKISMLGVLFILCMTLGAGNLYAVCTVTRGKVEVSQGAGSSCTSISEAVTKAGQAATATNPVIVSVLPGTYAENNGVTMQPYVSLVGSGRESTKITSNFSTAVRGGNNSAIENIWIDINGTLDWNAAAIYNDNAAMRINNVKVTMNTLNGHNTAGIVFHGPVKGIISNSEISVSGDRDVLGVTQDSGAEIAISNCTIDITGAGTNSNEWTSGVLLNSNSNMTIRDSVITSTGTLYNSAVYMSGGALTISNSELTATLMGGNGSQNDIVRTSGSGAVVSGSRLFLIGTASHNCLGVGKIGGSMISGYRNQSGSCGSATIVNSWDENFSTITQ